MCSDSKRKVDDTISTRIISQRSLTLDGVEFQWWAVGDHPALVTVRSKVFGSLAEFSYADAADFALKLARRLLLRHYEHARSLEIGKPRRPTNDVPLLARPGWFEQGPDTTSTLF